MLSEGENVKRKSDSAEGLNNHIHYSVENY
jgi:hypothetical protein